MYLEDLKNALLNIDTVNFLLPDKTFVPEHFHVTEVGVIEKKFIDCGGTIRAEKVVNLQLWYADDHDHRLSAQKLLKIIQLSENKLGIENLPIEVEYQSDTIGKYGLSYNGKHFVLETKQTDCLAKDNCGIPEDKVAVAFKELVTMNANACTPGSGCC